MRSAAKIILLLTLFDGAAGAQTPAAPFVPQPIVPGGQIVTKAAKDTATFVATPPRTR